MNYENNKRIQLKWSLTQWKSQQSAQWSRKFLFTNKLGSNIKGRNAWPNSSMKTVVARSDGASNLLAVPPPSPPSPSENYQSSYNPLEHLQSNISHRQHGPHCGRQSGESSLGVRPGQYSVSPVHQRDSACGLGEIYHLQCQQRRIWKLSNYSQWTKGCGSLW